MTFAPGKAQREAMSGSWDRDLATDLGRLRDEYRAENLVCLLEDHELRELGITDLEKVAAEAGISVRRFPIRDFGVPRSLPETRSLVEWILGEIRAGRVVVLCCKGGLGRTGTIAACVLAGLGAPASAAIACVRSVRSGAVETSEQERFVQSVSKDDK